MQFNSRAIALVMVLVLLATTAAVATATSTVTDPNDCPAGTIATPVGDGNYTCDADPNYVPPVNPPDPCGFPFGDSSAAGNACPPNPCNGIAGDIGASMACPPPVVNAPANNPPAESNEGEISFNDSDLGVALIKTEDANGSPVLEVFDMHNHTNSGNFMFSITQQDLAPFVGNPPAENTLLHAQGHVAVYVLDTGEIQMNVGPDSEGKIHVKIFDGIPWTHVYGYVIEPA